MYLRIEIAPKDRIYHRFLWHSLDQDKIPDEYEFNRVVFGVNSSPFQAQFVVQQHAKAHENTYTMAADLTDDSMDSVPTDAQGIELYHQLSELYQKADMYPHKWLSNSVKVLEHVPTAKKEKQMFSWKDRVMNVLWLIRSPSRKYQSFVANRIGEVQTTTNPNQWRHVPSEENPADLLTRGV